MNKTKYEVIFGEYKLEFTNTEIALRSAYALSRQFTVKIIERFNDDIVQTTMLHWGD